MKRRDEKEVVRVRRYLCLSPELQCDLFDRGRLRQDESDMATECGGINIRASTFEKEVLIVKHDIQMRSLLSRILLGVERDPCHLTDLTYRINNYIYSVALKDI